MMKEPLAIVGIGCRFPGGANDPDSFWDLLINGRSGITHVPPKRWSHRRYCHPDTAISGKTNVKWGGFIDFLDRFDAQFFGISPREAHRMDPQQRWLLEVSWEAIEDAGIPPSLLRGLPIGVYVGISSNEYGFIQLGNWKDIDVHTNSGLSICIAANRISYLFDLRGPSLAIDTACSSALVAVKSACHSIWSGECQAALAGGVNALITPDLFFGFSKASMLSPTGQCYTFDSRADGYVRSEGAGMIFIRPLTQALQEEDRIYALILACVANQDGNTSSMTVPSAEAQAAMLRQAYEEAGVSPHTVIYMEAHGTGTPVGDPVEAKALSSFLSKGRPNHQPCLIGSVKTNIGHLEAASGIAGLIKGALMLHHDKVPPVRNFQSPNPKIPFDRLNLQVATSLRPLPRLEGIPAVIGVNSFGFGGTNAHVVLQAAPREHVPKSRHEPRVHRPCLLPISARHEVSLRRYAQSYQELLAEPSTPLRELCSNAGRRKEHHPLRLVVIGRDRAEMRTHLDQWLDGQETPHVLSGEPSVKGPGLVFVFTGQGAQWWGMGQELLRKEALFAQTLERIDTIFKGLSSFSLLEEMQQDETSSHLDCTQIAQPAIFALQVALVQLWKSWGIQPDAIVGHSVGEVAAAYCAGVYALEDAVTIIFHRSRLQQTAGGRGGMAAVGIPVEEARQALRGKDSRVELAGINSPYLVTLSGDPEPLQEVVEPFEKAGRFVRWLPIKFAFHTNQMDPIRQELLSALSRIRPHPNSIPLFSTVTGERHPGKEWTASYWWHNVRQTVQFGPAINELIEEGYTHFLEIGPHPALYSAINDCLANKGQSGLIVHSLRRGKDESQEMLRNLARLHIHGYTVDWKSVNQGSGGFVPLPRYPWNHETFWMESEASRELRLSDPCHAFLNTRVQSPHPTWQFTLDLRLFSYLRDHRIWGSVIVPASAYAEMGLALAHTLYHQDSHMVEDLVMKQACFIAEGSPPTIQIVLDETTKIFSVFSSTDNNPNWTLHAEGCLRKMAPSLPDPVDLERLCSPMEEFITHDTYYEQYTAAGYQFGTNFQQLTGVWKKPGEAVSHIVSPHAIRETREDYVFHPALLDACLHGTRAAVQGSEDGDGNADTLYLPTSFRRIQLYTHTPPLTLWTHTIKRFVNANTIIADIAAYDEQGRPVAQILGFRAERVEQQTPVEAVSQRCLYQLRWQESPLGVDDRVDPPQSAVPPFPEQAPKTYIIFADRGVVGQGLAKRLRHEGSRTILVFAGKGFARKENDVYRIAPHAKEDLEALMAEILSERGSSTVFIHCWSLDLPSPEELSEHAFVQAQRPGVLHAFFLAQIVGGQETRADSRIYLVTRGAQRVSETDGVPGLVSSTLWGFARCASTEDFHHQWTLIDLDPASPHTAVSDLYEEIAHPNKELETAYRGGHRHVHRLCHIKAEDLPKRTFDAVHDNGTTTPFRLEMDKPGIFEGLSLNETQRRDPGPHEVEVQVKAGGINFRDLMKVLGMYPGDPAHLKWLGDDFAGKVEQIGKNVQGLAVGDRVAGLGHSVFKSFVTVDSNSVFKIPETLSFAQAATFPTAFLTAYYALHWVARMQPGERVLIHAAAGGVGQAAIQIARQLGLEIFATAGTPEKRKWLKDMGIAHVMDSRSLHFADQILDLTNGKGVDGVLNSLSGEFIPKGLSVLAPFGRFLELGKVDVYKNTKIGLEALRNNISYHVIDMAQLLEEKPQIGIQLMEEIAERIARGEYSPLPHQVFPITDAEDAFRRMAHGKHMGKVILDFQVPSIPIGLCTDSEHLFRAHATYLITGGASGVGLEVAKWMADHGARHLALFSRSGPRSDADRGAIEKMRSQGITVLDVRGDVTCLAHVFRLIQQLSRDLPPLMGVIHCAMVLDDEFVVRLDGERLLTVLGPKVMGGWNLHLATLTCPLEHFICFSSISAITGPAKQANYAAANAFLDALASYRKSRGLPALSINWGALQGAGLLERHPETAAYLEKMGQKAFTIEQATGLLKRFLFQDAPQLAASHMDWNSLARLSPLIANSPVFSQILREFQKDQGDGSLKARILAALPEERQQMVEDFIARQLAAVFGTDASHIDRSTPLTNLGLDSLMAVELMLRIQEELHMNFPVGRVVSGPNLKEISNIVVETLCGQGKSPDESLATQGQQKDTPLDKADPMFSSETEGPPNTREAHATTSNRLPSLIFADYHDPDSLPRVDAVALNYLHDYMWTYTGLDRQSLAQRICRGEPILVEIRELPWGRIGTIHLPYFEEELLKKPPDLIERLRQAIALSSKIGATTVALTGVLPALTDQGKTLNQWCKEQFPLLKLTTGEAMRASTMVKSMVRVLETTGRQMNQEILAWIGLGDFGKATLYLTLTLLPHPVRLILADPNLSPYDLDKLAQTLREAGYQGEIQMPNWKTATAAALYQATFIAGTTSLGGGLDVAQFQPGTLFVDYSFPPLVSLEETIARLEQQGDILFTSGAHLRLENPINQTFCLPKSHQAMAQALIQERGETLWTPDLQEIPACVLVSLLTGRFSTVMPTVGPVQLQDVKQHYQVLEHLGIQSACLQMNGYVIPPDHIKRFRERFGGTPFSMDPVGPEPQNRLDVERSETG